MKLLREKKKGKKRASRDRGRHTLSKELRVVGLHGGWLSGFVALALRCALFFFLVLLIVGAPSAVVWCFCAAFRAVAVSASITGNPNPNGG